MISANDLLNKINAWGAPAHDAFTRHVSTRVANVCATTPTQALSTAGHILATPFQAVGAVLNGATRVVYKITGSETLHNFADKLPNIRDLLDTVGKVILHALGTIFSATLGVISPSANFKVQVALGLATDTRAEELQRTLDEAAAKIAAKLAAEKKAIEKQIAEMEVLNNLAKAHTIANQAAADAADSITQDISAMFAKAEEVAAKTKHDVKENLQEIEEDVNGVIREIDHEGAHVVTRIADALSNGGSALANGAYKIGHYATLGFFFKPEAV